MAYDFEIRIAQLQDEPVVSALLEACYPKLMAGSYEADLLARALPLMTRANPALLSSGCYYLAETASGDVVGCGGWSAAHPGSGEQEAGLAHIRHFATHPEMTRRGIGRALFNRCAEDAKAAAAKRFQCYASLNAEVFYQAMGFKPLRSVAVQMDPKLRFPSILMECDLR